MKRILQLTAAALLLGGSATVGIAQVPNAPEISKSSNAAAFLSNLSDNGKWGVSELADETSASGAIIYNMETGQSVGRMTLPEGAQGSGVDISDDGNTIVGTYGSQCAYYTVADQKWHILPNPKGSDGKELVGIGRLLSVTPDGKYAVGVYQLDETGKSEPVYYDLSKDELIVLPNLPRRNNWGAAPTQHWFCHISSDGRYILGNIDQIYYHEGTYYVYDTQNQTYKKVGFTEAAVGHDRPRVDGLYFLDSAEMSCNGRWVTAVAYMVKPIDGSDFPLEYRATLTYDVENDKVEILDSNGDNNYGGGLVDDNGHVIAYQADGNPYPEATVPYNGFHYPLDRVLQEGYGIDFYAVSGMTFTGKPLASTADGKTIIMGGGANGSYDSYTIRISEPLEEGAKRVNLLSRYTVSPTEGSSLSNTAPISLNFLYNVKIQGKPNQIKLTDDKGTAVANAVGATIEDKNKRLAITFRPKTLEAGVKYTITIPAGFLSMLDNEKMLSPEIKLSYIGRTAKPVEMTSSSPVSGAALGLIDQNNPLMLTFDSTIKLAKSATAEIYRNDEETPFYTLFGAVNENQLALAPSSPVYLYETNNYKVVIPTGAITDVVGNNPNNEIVLEYVGSFRPSISQDDKYLFKTACENYLDLMFYEGDHREPNAIASGTFNFQTDATPWLIMQDRNPETGETNLVLGSSSMYTDKGQADDWFSLPQLLIPDENCVLKFQGQGYYLHKKDVLKVYIYPCDTYYNDSQIPESMMKEVKQLTPVFNKVLSPGKSQEDLFDDWTDFAIDLKEYAGKKIYILFQNDNTDQSIVFLDNISVEHNMIYMVSVTTPGALVAKTEAEIGGVIIADNALTTYNSLQMTLLDAEGTEISRISASDLGLKQGDSYNFLFPDKLPLEIGKVVAYSIKVNLDGDETIVEGTVRNQAFEPVKRVLIEEYSGTACANCPRGFVAIDYLQELYGDLIIPAIYRTYGSKRESPGVGSVTQYIGCEALGAPSGVVNRSFMPSGPTGIDVANNCYTFSGRDFGGEDTWLDNVRDAFKTPAEASVEVRSTYDETTKNIDITTTVAYAVEAKNKSLNMYLLVTEDGVITNQQNNLSSSTDPLIGEWGAGGIYGSALVTKLPLDHVARGILTEGYAGVPLTVPAEIAPGKDYEFGFSFTLPDWTKDIKNSNILAVLIDANTGQAINSRVCRIGEDSAGIEEIPAEGTDANIGIANLGNGQIAVSGNGALSAQAFSIDGRLLASANGSDMLVLNAGNYRGIAIVSAIAADGRTVRKLIIR